MKDISGLVSENEAKRNQAMGIYLHEVAEGLGDLENQEVAIVTVLFHTGNDAVTVAHNLDGPIDDQAHQVIAILQGAITCIKRTGSQ